MPERRSLSGGFQAVGNYAARGVSNVDARLSEVLREAAGRFPGYSVEAYSGYRPGDKRQHGRKRAVDVRLRDLKTGKLVENYQNAKAFRTYEKFAQTVRSVQQQMYPDLNSALRWGGYFSGKKGVYGALDLMHFDLGGLVGLGMAGGSWAKGLTKKQRGLFPGAESVGMTGNMMDVAGPWGAARNPMPTPANRGLSIADQYAYAGMTRSLAPRSPMSQAQAYGQLAESMRGTGLQNIGGKTTYSAPLGRVERGRALGSVAPNRETISREYSRAADSMSEGGVRGVGYSPGRSQTIGNMLSGMDNPTYGPGQVAPASRQTPSKQTVTRAYKEYAVTRAQAPKAAPAPKAPDLTGLTISRNPFDTMQTPVAPVTAPVPAPRPVAPVPAPVPRMVVRRVIRNVPVKRAQTVKQVASVLSPMQFRNALGFNATGPVNRSVFGYGGQAIDAIKGGAGVRGSTAFSRSNPSVSYTALGNGTVAMHNAQFGTTQYSYAGPTQSLFGGRALGGGSGGRGGFKDSATRDAGYDRSPGAASEIDKGGGGLY